MIGHAADPETFAIRIAGYGCQIGVKSGKNLLVQQWLAVLGAEDQMNEDE